MSWSDDPQDAPGPIESTDTVSAVSAVSAGSAVPTDASPVTGDEQIDTALGQLDAVADEPLATHIEAAEHMHEVLQGRLSDLGDG